MMFSTGAALAACPTQPTSTPFAQFADNNSYFVALGGSFEDTAQNSWWIYNPGLTSGNEPWDVTASSDSQSLQINSGSFATSPSFCAGPQGLEDSRSRQRIICAPTRSLTDAAAPRSAVSSRKTRSISGALARRSCSPTGVVSNGRRA
jgi:hypothetical protein